MMSLGSVEVLEGRLRIVGIRFQISESRFERFETKVAIMSPDDESSQPY